MRTASERQIFAGMGEQVVEFIENYVVQTKGRWAGDLMIMEPWERDFIDELFLVYDDGENVYDEALLGVARKNGKSSISAALALYMLLAAGEEGPEVYAAATSRDQARVVFNQTKEYINASPRLKDWLQPYKDVIQCKANNGIFRVLSADALKNYGLNPFGVVIDELWAHVDPELYYALTTAQGARENPLVVNITTAGFDQATKCFELYERGKALHDEGIDAMRRAGFLFQWHEAPTDLAIDDRRAWEAANPSSWITEDYLARKLDRLPENVFRRLHLNQWVEKEDAWIAPHMWDACRGRIRFDREEWTYMAVDVGTRKDSAAIVWGQWHGDRLHVGHLILLPEDQASGFGVADIRNTVIAKAHNLGRVRDIAHDPWSFKESGEIIAEKGLPVFEFPQTDGRMGPASEILYELVTDGRLVHDDDREARRQVMDTVAQPTTRGGWMISKRRSKERIDYTVALAMVADRAVTLRNTKPKRRGAAFL